MSNKPWSSGSKRKSWCDPNSLCDYCRDALYEGNKKKQACRFRPSELKLKRFHTSKLGRKVVAGSKEEVKFSNLVSEEGGRKYYSKFHRGSLEVNLGDFVYLTAPEDKPHFIAEVLHIFEEGRSPTVTVRWLFRIGETNVTPTAIIERKSEEEKKQLAGLKTLDESVIIHSQEVPRHLITIPWQ
eukprot:TRINITY_DN1055_c0_g1_i1.p1 TRINITY_DN1055_c0_g1~~TRINITY_DN1055_c0_g1_i1.p1  ORF type:complete len:184 (-),score=30.68 TRINITY_DN1055_c0_g1_i1:61-612(-)